MKNDHNIDRLFQESFKDFEVSAPENAWQNIERRLKENSGKTVIPLWRRLTAAVAILAILLFGVSQWYFSPNLSNTPVTDNSTNAIPDTNPGESNMITPNQPDVNPVIVASSTDENSKLQQADDVNTPNSDQLSANRNSFSRSAPTEDQSMAMANNTSSFAKPEAQENTTLILAETDSKTDSNIALATAVASNQKLNATQGSERDANNNKETEISLVEVANFLALEDEKNNAQKEENTFKGSWYIKPQISPVFYGNMASGSAVDDGLAQNSGQGEVDLSYGLNVGYQVSKKVKIRTGINRVNLNYTTNDLFTLPGSDVAALANVNSADGVIASVVTSQQLDNLVDSNQFGRQEAIASDLRQSIGFIEFPLEVEYKLLDKKFAINIIGGASTFLLNDNSLDVINTQGTTTIGEANNINDLSFSTNVALGFDYSLTERFLLNLEPSFKYQLNTFESGTTDFQPYFFGIYTGFIFKF